MKSNWRKVIFWLIGSILIFFGAFIAGKLNLGLGVSQTGFLFALFLALALIMFGGLLWILVAAALSSNK